MKAERRFWTQMINLSGKKILLMGATGNTGKATAVKLAQLGANVILSGRDDKKGDEILSSLSGGGHRYVQFDVRNIQEVQNFINDIIEFDKTKLDGLVYAAGLMHVLPIKNTTYKFLHDIMLVNYFAFAEITRCFSNRKNSNAGSSIVALSSYAAINGDKGQLAYAASKGAMDSSIIVMAKELYAKGIRVNAIRPAIIAQYEYDELLQRTRRLVDMMQTGMIEPEILAEQIAFLLSDASSGVYGRCFDVRGYLG